MSSCGRNIVPAPRASRLVSNRRVGAGWYLLRLAEPSLAQSARPGQFVQIRCGDGIGWDPLLRRPFSVYSADPAAGTYDILYTDVGRGTGWLARLSEARGAGTAAAPGEPQSPPEWLDVEGPFGNAFSPAQAPSRAYLVGGGVGVAPLYFLARQLLASARPPEVTVCMGARTRTGLQGIEDFRRLGIRAETATDDGSEGFHGRVTELLDELLGREQDPNLVLLYGCGPQGMNESLRALAVRRSLWCEICLEAIMACGFGICFACVAPIRRELGGEYYNRRLCWEGPVFDARLLYPGIDGVAACRVEEPK